MTELPPTMKAWRYHRADGGVENHLQLEDLPLPSLPSDGHSTLIKVLHVALNPVDIKFSEVPCIGRFLHPFPAIPGCDGVGRVVKTSDADSALKPDQLVAFRKQENRKDGALAEYVVVPREGCVPVPEGVSPVQAATVGTCGVTALQAIVPYLPAEEDGGRKRKIFINGGSGGAGTFQIQIAKILGCHVTTSCSGQNVELCKSLGADEVIDYRQGPVHKALAELVKDPKGPEAFDLVVDNIDAPWERYKAADSYLRPGGTYVQIGADITVQNAWQGICIMTLPGFLGNGHRRWQFVAMKTSHEDAARVLGWMAEGRVKVPIDAEFPFQDVPDAYRRLKGHRTKGKIVVNVE